MPEYSAQSFVQELISLANSLEGELPLYVDLKQLRLRIDSLGGLDKIQECLLNDRAGHTAGRNDFHVVLGDFKDRADIWHALGIDSSDVPDSPRRKIENRFSNR